MSKIDGLCTISDKQKHRKPSMVRRFNPLIRQPMRGVDPGRPDGQTHGDLGDGAGLDDVGVLVALTSATALRSYGSLCVVLYGQKTANNMGNDKK